MGKVINGIECEECLAPELVRFQTGDVVEGVLLQRDAVTIGGKRVLQYTVEKTDGVVVKFNGTADIIQKLRPDLVGHFIHVACVGEDQMVKRGDNCMKVFEIYASSKPVGRVRVEASASGGAVVTDGTEITDADIPF